MSIERGVGTAIGVRANTAPARSVGNFGSREMGSFNGVSVRSIGSPAKAAGERSQGIAAMKSNFSEARRMQSTPKYIPEGPRPTRTSRIYEMPTKVGLAKQAERKARIYDIPSSPAAKPWVHAETMKNTFASLSKPTRIATSERVTSEHVKNSTVLAKATRQPSREHQPLVHIKPTVPSKPEQRLLWLPQAKTVPSPKNAEIKQNFLKAVAFKQQIHQQHNQELSKPQQLEQIKRVAKIYATPDTKPVSLPKPEVVPQHFSKSATMAKPPVRELKGQNTMTDIRFKPNVQPAEKKDPTQGIKKEVTVQPATTKDRVYHQLSQTIARADIKKDALQQKHLPQQPLSEHRQRFAENKPTQTSGRLVNRVEKQPRNMFDTAMVRQQIEQRQGQSLLEKVTNERNTSVTWPETRAALIETLQRAEQQKIHHEVLPKTQRESIMLFTRYVERITLQVSHMEKVQETMFGKQDVTQMFTRTRGINTQVIVERMRREIQADMFQAQKVFAALQVTGMTQEQAQETVLHNVQVVFQRKGIHQKLVEMMYTIQEEECDEDIEEEERKVRNQLRMHQATVMIIRYIFQTDVKADEYRVAMALRQSEQAFSNAKTITGADIVAGMPMPEPEQAKSAVLAGEPVQDNSYRYFTEKIRQAGTIHSLQHAQAVIYEAKVAHPAIEVSPELTTAPVTDRQVKDVLDSKHPAMPTSN